MAHELDRKLAEQASEHEKVVKELMEKSQTQEQRLLDLEFVLFKMNDEGKSDLFAEIYNKINQVSEEHRNEEEKLKGVVDVIQIKALNVDIQAEKQHADVLKLQQQCSDLMGEYARLNGNMKNWQEDYYQKTQHNHKQVFLEVERLNEEIADINIRIKRNTDTGASNLAKIVSVENANAKIEDLTKDI